MIRALVLVHALDTGSAFVLPFTHRSGQSRIPWSSFTLSAKLDTRDPNPLEELVICQQSPPTVTLTGGGDDDRGYAKKMGNRRISQLQLLGCAALWGSYPTAIKLLYCSDGAYLDAPIVTLLRFGVMAVVSVGSFAISGQVIEFGADRSPWAEQLERRAPSSLLACALELGVLGFIGTYLNASGLQTVPALQGGILLSFINIFTPALSSIAGSSASERQVPVRIWSGSALALVVSAFALAPDSPGTEFAAMGRPDGEAAVGVPLLLGAALCFSAAKVRLGAHLKVHAPGALSTVRLVAQFGFALLGFAVIDAAQVAHASPTSPMGGSGALFGVSEEAGDLATWVSHFSPNQALLVTGSALASGCGATWLQAQGQRAIPASEAQLIYSLTPIFAAFWSFTVLSEPISFHEATGGVLLVAGAIVAIEGGTGGTTPGPG